MVSVDPAWNILTCPSQNVDEEMSKLVAVKIIQTYRHEQGSKFIFGFGSTCATRCKF